MIFITGDTHGNIDIQKLSSKNFTEGKTLTKNDYVIICGDFGLVWDGSNSDKYWQKWLQNKPWTTLFIDGNHENFNLLFDLPETNMFHNTVKVVNESVFYLPRGQIFTIEDKTFFTMGGARSHDQGYRRENISWWPQEMPSTKEMNKAIENLNQANWHVDYVLTHCAPNSIQKDIQEYYEFDPLTSFLEHVKSELKFEKWFFGHYHEDLDINPNFQALYHRIIKI